MDDDKIQKALKQYQNQLKASASYYERKRQEKIQNGTYRGRGRPRKMKTDEVKVENV